MKKIFYSFFSLLIFISAKESFALRCNGNIVSKGDSKSEVILNCGEPTFKNNLQIQKTIIKKYAISNRHKIYIEIEHWLYDFGARRFTQLLEFEDDKLVKITTGGYGGRNSHPKFCQEFLENERIGDSKPQIIMKCGEPDKIERKEEYTTIIQSTSQYDIFLTINVDEWTYELGSSVLRFENGRVKRIFSKKREN